MAVPRSENSSYAFSSKKKLSPGVYVIKPVGGTQYDVEVLTKNDLDTILRALEEAKPEGIETRDWENIKEKVGKAVKDANDAIFKLMSLPLELREKVYEFVLLGSKLVSKLPVNYYRSRVNPYALMQTSKMLYADTKRTFYRNTFLLPEIRLNIGNRIDLGLQPVALQQNLTDVIFHWDCSSRPRDAAIIEFMAGCKQLKYLSISIDLNTFVKSKQPTNLRNNGDVVDRFTRLVNWKGLIALRGLKKVSIKCYPDARNCISEEEIGTLVKYLNKEMSQAKTEPLPKKLGSRKAKAGGKKFAAK